MPEPLVISFAFLLGALGFSPPSPLRLFLSSWVCSGSFRFPLSLSPSLRLAFFVLLRLALLRLLFAFYPVTLGWLAFSRLLLSVLLPSSRLRLPCSLVRSPHLLRLGCLCPFCGFSSSCWFGFSVSSSAWGLPRRLCGCPPLLSLGLPGRLGWGFFFPTASVWFSCSLKLVFYSLRPGMPLLLDPCRLPLLPSDGLPCRPESLGFSSFVFLLRGVLLSCFGTSVFQVCARAWDSLLLRWRPSSLLGGGLPLLALVWTTFLSIWGGKLRP